METLGLNDEKLENLILHQFKKNTFSSSTPIIPDPGFVVKSKITEIKVKKDKEDGKNVVETEEKKVVETEEKDSSDNYNWTVGMKVFCNLCHSPSIPAPPLVSKEEIIKAIKNDDSSTYKVPLSLSKPRSDIAKGNFYFRKILYML